MPHLFRLGSTRRSRVAATAGGLLCALVARSDAFCGVLRLSLEAAVGRALTANRDLQQARDRAVEARFALEDATEDREWRIRPGVNLQVGGDGTAVGGSVGFERLLPTAGWLSFSPQLQMEPGGEVRSLLHAAFTQPLLRGAGREAAERGLASARTAGQRAGSALHLKRVEIVLATVTAFFDAARRQEMARLAGETAARMYEHAEFVAARENSGLSSPQDLYRARRESSRAAEEQRVALAALDRSLDDLKLLLALPVGEEIAVAAAPEPEPALPTEESAIETALARRVELPDDALQLEETERLARLARAEVLPDLTLQLAWTRASESGAPADVLSDGTDSWWVGLGSAGDRSRSAARREHQRRLLAVEEARRAYAARRDQIASQVRRELEAITRLGERIPADREALADAESQLELARVRFRHGHAGIEDLLEAEHRLSQMRLELVSAGFDSAVGVYRLRAALGTLLAAAPDAVGTP